VTNRHDSACRRSGAAEEPSRPEPRAKRIGLDEVRERLHAVDLDDGQELAVAHLEPSVVGDVDELELEPELGAGFLHDLDRALAQAAVARVEDGDDGYG
jgi:hypothetical protein